MRKLVLLFGLTVLGCGNGDDSSMKPAPSSSGGSQSSDSGAGGTAGSGGTPSASGGQQNPPINMCVSENRACSPETGQLCCAGLLCVLSDNPELAGCRPPCSTHDECASKCCEPFTGATSGFCAPERYCSCGEEGANCGPNEAGCCGELQCTGFDAASFTCNKTCMAPTDCSSNCCVPITGRDFCVCAPANVCNP